MAAFLKQFLYPFNGPSLEPSLKKVMIYAMCEILYVMVFFPFKLFLENDWFTEH